MIKKVLNINFLKIWRIQINVYHQASNKLKYGALYLNNEVRDKTLGLVLNFDKFSLLKSIFLRKLPHKYKKILSHIFCAKIRCISLLYQSQGQNLKFVTMTSSCSPSALINSVPNVNIFTRVLLPQKFFPKRGKLVGGSMINIA